MFASVARLRIVLLSLAVVAVCLPASAQDKPPRTQENPFQLVLGVTPGASYSEIDGFDFQHGFSIGLDYFLASRWAVEVRGQIDGYARTSSGEDLEAYSLDLAGQYDLFRGDKWRFFSAAGLRYAKSDFRLTGLDDDSGLGLLVGLGTEFSLSRRFALRLDATAVPIDLGGYDERRGDVILGVGFGFRF